MVLLMEMVIMSSVMDPSIMEKWKKIKLILMMATYTHFYSPIEEASKITISVEKVNNKPNPTSSRVNTTTGRKSLEI